MAHNHVYVICEDKCWEESYTAEQIDRKTDNGVKHEKIADTLAEAYDFFNGEAYYRYTSHNEDNTVISNPVEIRTASSVDRISSNFFVACAYGTARQYVVGEKLNLPYFNATAGDQVHLYISKKPVANFSPLDLTDDCVYQVTGGIETTGLVTTGLSGDLDLSITEEAYGYLIFVIVSQNESFWRGHPKFYGISERYAQLKYGENGEVFPKVKVDDDHIKQSADGTLSFAVDGTLSLLPQYTSTENPAIQASCEYTDIDNISMVIQKIRADGISPKYLGGTTAGTVLTGYTSPGYYYVQTPAQFTDSPFSVSYSLIVLRTALSVVAQIALASNDALDTLARIRFYNSQTRVVGSWRSINVGGVSVSADKLTTPRNIAGHAFDGTQDVEITAADVGLGNVDNTSDLDKPISDATQTALNAKVSVVTGKGLSTNDYTTAEKTKLAGIATGANNYILPTASSTVLGGVKVGNNLSISNGVLSATNTVTTATTTGSGNAVTSVTSSNGALTVNKGSTFSLSNHTHTPEQIGAAPASAATADGTSYSNAESGIDATTVQGALDEIAVAVQNRYYIPAGGTATITMPSASWCSGILQTTTTSLVNQACSTYLFHGKAASVPRLTVLEREEGIEAIATSGTITITNSGTTQIGLSIIYMRRYAEVSIS